MTPHQHDNLRPLVLGFQQSPGEIKLTNSQVFLHVVLGPLVGDEQIHCGILEATVVQARGSSPIIKPFLKKTGFHVLYNTRKKVRVSDGRNFPQRQTLPKMRSSTPNAGTMAAAASDILSSTDDHVEIWSTVTRGITWGVYLSTRFCAQALQCETRHTVCLG